MPWNLLKASLSTAHNPIKPPKLPQSSIGVLNTSTDFRWRIGNRGVAILAPQLTHNSVALSSPSFLLFSSEFPLVKWPKGRSEH